MRARLLFAVMLPASVLALVALSFLASGRFQRVQGDLRTAAVTAIRQWSAPAARGLRAGDVATLEAIVEAAADPGAIASVRILSTRGRARAIAHVDAGGGMAADLGVWLLSLTAAEPYRPPRIARTLGYAAPAPRALGSIEVATSASHAGRAFLAAILLPASGILGLLIGAGLLAIVTTSGITRALQHLHRHISEIEAGNMDARTPARAPREIGALGFALDRMAAGLEQGRQRLQAEIQRTTAELQQTLQAVETQNTELETAHKQALAASRVKSEFLANVSHEIRTPINGIVGFADLLHHGPLDSQQRDYVSVIKESCTNLLTIINDILDFSKIEAGKLVIDHVVFDLRDCVEDVLSLLAPAAYGKGLELIHLVYSDVPLKLYGDPIRVRQVLTNLVHNAIKFTPAGRVVVRVMLDTETAHDALLRITVTDTGIGLDSGGHSDVFEAFNQADTSLTRRFSGTGLGLAISRKLLEQMGGSIGVESESGTGSTFWFTLRCQKQPGVHGAGHTGWHNPLHGARALLYDASPLSRLAIRHLLELWDLRVTEVDDRHALLSLASAGPRYDVAVVGLSGQELDGRLSRETLPRLRDHGLPVLIMASTVDRNDSRMLRQRGGSVCLPKAVRRQTVFRELCRLIDDEGGPTPADAHDTAMPATAAAGLPHHGMASILVVDDNAINRRLVTALATRHGALPSQCEDGPGAVEACRHTRFDVIFMDIHMPGMSGEATAQAIRELYPPGQRRPRIVALTANATPGERERLLASGMDECLIKPVTEAQMAIALSGQGAEPELMGIDNNSAHPLRASMRAMLLAELPDHRRLLRHAYRRGDLSALKERIHKLHGAVSACALPQLQHACQQLEHAITRDNRVEVPAGMEQVIREINVLLDPTEGAGSDADRQPPAPRMQAPDRARR